MPLASSLSLCLCYTTVASESGFTYTYIHTADIHYMVKVLNQVLLLSAKLVGMFVSIMTLNVVVKLVASYCMQKLMSSNLITSATPIEVASISLGLYGLCMYVLQGCAQV